MDLCRRVENILEALFTARKLLNQAVPWWPAGLRDEDMEVYCWTQTWGDTSCGFGGIAGRAMTQCDVVVLALEPTKVGPVAVFVGNRFAYAFDKPSAAFWQDFDRRCLKGPRQDVSEYCK